VIKAYLLAVQTRVDLLHHMDHLSARIMLFVGTRSPFANEGYVYRCPRHPLLVRSLISSNTNPSCACVCAHARLVSM